MSSSHLTPAQARAAVKRNLERGLAATTAEGALYQAAAAAVTAASVRADGDGELIPASAGGAVLAVSEAADELFRCGGQMTAAALLLALVQVVKRLDEDRDALDDRQAQNLAIAQRWIAKYAEEARPRRRRLRWRRSRL